MENVLPFDYLAVIAATFCGLLNAGVRLSFHFYENPENIFLSPFN